MNTIIRHVSVAHKSHVDKMGSQLLVVEKQFLAVRIM